MRRLPLILGLVLIAAATVREIYDFLVTNEGVRYFSSEPRRILYVVLLGIAGGAVAFGISRLSPRSRRTLRLTLLGTAGAFLIGMIGLFAYHLTWAAPMLTQAGVWGWISAPSHHSSSSPGSYGLSFGKLGGGNEGGGQPASGANSGGRTISAFANVVGRRHR